MNLTKRIFQFTALVAFFSLASCSTDIEPYEGGIPPSANPTVSSQFKVDFDGQTFTANEVVAIKSIQTTPAGQVVSYTISGNLNNGTSSKAVSLQFFEHVSNNYALTVDPPANTGVGTVSYIEDANTQNAYLSFNPNQAFNNQGQITVTSNDVQNQIISGNFNANVYLLDENTQQVIGTKVLSNGVFTNVHYTISTIP